MEGGSDLHSIPTDSESNEHHDIFNAVKLKLNILLISYNIILIIHILNCKIKKKKQLTFLT